jgi:hypothetical protein
MRILLVSAVALCFGLVGTPASEASDCDGDALGIAGHIFDTSDTNADGALTPAEFAEAGLERYGVAFAEFDVDGDGLTSVDEFFDLFEMHHPPGETI